MIDDPQMQAMWLERERDYLVVAEYATDQQRIFRLCDSAARCRNEAIRCGLKYTIEGPPPPIYGDVPPFPVQNDTVRVTLTECVSAYPCAVPRPLGPEGREAQVGLVWNRLRITRH
jgi:hypothetical protein